MSVLTTATVFNKEVLKPGSPVLVTVGLTNIPAYQSQTTGVVLSVDLNVIELALYAPASFDKGGLIQNERQMFTVGSSDDLGLYYIDIKDIQNKIVDIRVMPTMSIDEVRFSVGIVDESPATSDDDPF